MALAVANAPARMYNPLFVYGGVGLGKTHLMQAIGHQVMRQNKAAEVIYVSGETFLFHVVTSIREDRMAEFRRRYRNVDIWLVDDIQYIAEAERTEVEFFHIFNSLYDTNKQIVICSDRPPKELQLIEGRLRSRFEWGMITHIEPPDLEHRIAILQKKARDEGIDVANDVLQFIADKIKTNIRTLEGALTRLLAHASLNNSRVTLEMAVESLKHYSTGEEEAVQVTLDIILQAVSDYYQISLEELTGKKRHKEVVLPRQVGMFLAKEMTSNSFPEIGSAFGRDHSTVIHSYDKIKSEVRESRELRTAVNEIRTKALVIHMNLDKKEAQEEQNL
jgi:chromosomal replication initiator protein